MGHKILLPISAKRQERFWKKVIPSGDCVICGEPTVLYEPAVWDEYGQVMDFEYRCTEHRLPDIDQDLRDAIAKARRSK
jgi:hypothetical protein